MPPLRIAHTRSGASATLGDVGDVVSVGRKEMCEICIPELPAALVKLLSAHDLLGLSCVQV